jgi:hypothetical protein
MCGRSGIETLAPGLWGHKQGGILSTFTAERVIMTI